ncbi:carcinine hydrolase/isopenicillin-N N-acyltransferase family protein [Amygdalobacter nucleatus]|uniref:Peptidase C45 hydrolase domain-containing protein n=1 Tax=Amygdalobacter nucleatus TaxID=3029274 RepID=A0A133YDQ5_9FIRM|nr:carcinine hydrolase/isopenicillin-N N-acyltransferase family protein [Amygdalobacter nucleatus]KXB41332.1 hypothetical protein HMPREF1872_00711 [Amygdalobacter nucleatus]MDF0485192.1 carcinine hydrolase/isopenicillin-N N-acyltransferase family protein [Amygdalobacter nucleatus]
MGIKKADEPLQLKKKINLLAAAYTPLDGINEKGLSVGICMTYQGPGKKGNIATDQQTDKKDITSTILLRLMLDKAATVDEAIQIAQSYDMHIPLNLPSITWSQIQVARVLYLNMLARKMRQTLILLSVSLKYSTMTLR